MSVGREVRITDQAARDLAQIANWYCMTGSAEQARQSLRTISQAIKNLVFTPLGSPLQWETGGRERNVAGHTIVYDVEPADGVRPCAGHVTVLHIYSPAAG